MTNEKDREEARRIIAAYNNLPVLEYFGDEVTGKRIAEEIARIRTEAVKAERDRIISEFHYLPRRSSEDDVLFVQADKFFDIIFDGNKPKESFIKEIKTIISICDGTIGPEDWVSGPCEQIQKHAKKALAFLSDDQEPNTANSDVNRDLLTIDRCIRYPGHFPGIALEASAALERLALLVKEEGRG